MREWWRKAGSENLRVPVYSRVVDFEAIYRRHPPVPEFAEEMFLWPPERIEAYKNQLFMEIMEVAWQNPFYQRKWAEAGIKKEDIRSIEDLPKLPIVTVSDFKEAIERDPPYGLHQGVTAKDAARIPLKIQTSGGTTGRPRPTFFGPLEWEIQALQTARGLYIQGARPGDVLQVPLTLSMANAGWVYYLACHYYLGMVPITPGSGVVTASRRQLEYAEAFGTNIWASFPEYLLHLGKTAQEMGLDLKKLPTKFITSFLGPDTEGHLRRQMEELWGCPVYDNYGTHEIGLTAFECQAKAGLHINEDMFIIEVADVETNEVLPYGQKGNLVATSLYREHPPLIRYNLMDLVRIFPRERCDCGSWFLRMDHFLGRSDDMVKLRGTNVYPMACLNAVQSDPRTTGQWLCVVDRITDPDGTYRDEMTVMVEYVDESVDKEALRRDLEVRLHADLGVRVQVQPVPAGELAELTNYGRQGEGKVRRLLDRRPGYQRHY
jgi:phenylacetate-CoA ligase